jgi:hypothetical protein
MDAVGERADQRVRVVRRLGAHVVGRERPRAQAVGAVHDDERAVVPAELHADLVRRVRDAVRDELAEHGFGGVEIARAIRVLFEIVAKSAAHPRGGLGVARAERPAARVGLDDEVSVLERRQGGLTFQQHRHHLLSAVPERGANDMPLDRRRSLLGAAVRGRPSHMP